MEEWNRANDIYVARVLNEEEDMEAITLSQEYQVVIPRKVREKMGLKPGEKLQVISLDNCIELVPVHPMSEMRGFLKGLDPSFEREQEDRV
jgi:AbrB family looped-hinge helix DNA binding protein